LLLGFRLDRIYIKEELMCDCTFDCPGISTCEIGTWTKPDLMTACKEAMVAILALGNWAFRHPRSTREMINAILDSEKIVHHPKKIDYLYGFAHAMEELGFVRLGKFLDSTIWHPYEPADGDRLPGMDEDDSSKVPIVVRQNGSLPVSKPQGIQRVLEFMVFMNAGILNLRHMRTSAVAAMLFPDSDEQVLRNWLIQALDECLYRVGYSPSFDEGIDVADPFGDAEWFCDGDPRDALHFNLWAGEVVKAD
jgi:hypothetical protein